ncbi:MAG: bifunctional oligoribonuclease/PAP phosphatase NrnA [Flavobacteriaceae bacterium]|nr:bifunctional oligoribonuclease/PAP phosphatase NrnA [Flavobacteriaceae bacterium]
MFSPDEIFELKSLFKIEKNIVIVPHKNPDGDAIGSCLGLSLILKKLGHDVQIISPNDFPKFLKWMPEAKKIFNAEFNPKGAEIAFSNADIIFMLDFNEPSRTDQLEKLIRNSDAIKILIDHHQNPEFFDFTYTDSDIPATCQMIWHFIEKMNWEDLTDANIATCLYTGILTDTGNFRYSSVKPSTHQVAAHLLNQGAEPFRIHDAMDSFGESRLKLLSVFLQNLQYFPEYRTAIFTLTREELLENGFQKGDTDAFVNYGLGLENVVFSVFMADDTQHDFVKLSFRSKGDFNTSEFANKHFNGGGHINASGGRFDDNLENTVKEFVNLLPQYEEKLQNTVI